MAEFKYPMRVKSEYGGVIVEFDGLNSGTVIEAGEDPDIHVGYHSTEWINHTDSRWTPVSTTKRKLHEMVRSIR